jgi:RecB family exonuclease
MVPEYFSPSALGSSGNCRLRLVMSSTTDTEWTERLVSGPEAAVGTLLHRVLERAGHRTATSPEQIFLDEYARAVDEIRRDPRRAHFAELASTKSLSEWTRLRAWVLARAAHETAKIIARGTNAVRFRPITGSEIFLTSSELRLRGKADRIRQLGPRTFEVRDFKTGATLDDEGKIKESIALQLQAYGLLLMEHGAADTVRLIVDDGEAREVPFDLDSSKAAKKAILRITGSMPAAGPTSAEELATPGAACWGCPVRHVCSAYRENAPKWWKRYPPEIDRLSSDVWGTVSDVFGNDSIDIVLRDDAGRRVRVDGLGARHGLENSVVGQRLWFFGLEASGATRGFDGARFHPRSFHELPRDRMERRAWAVEAFLETV